MIATATSSTVPAGAGAESRYQLAGANEFHVPRVKRRAKRFFRKGQLANQIHEHGRDRDVVNRACGYKG